MRTELEERLRARASRCGSRRASIPTRPDLHLGHTVLMQKMRQFQDLGHTVIFLVGDFTAMVGDPTGQERSRARGSRAKRCWRPPRRTQSRPSRCSTATRPRSATTREWLDKLAPVEIVELMAKMTRSRACSSATTSPSASPRSGRSTMHEFLYPLLQGYDSVALECDIELGGTDQLFNLLVGRDLMPRYGQRRRW